MNVDTASLHSGLRSRRRSTLALACLAQFMVVLDIAIVNVALPSIQRDLEVEQSALQWVIVAYGIPLGGFLLLGGRLADLWGPRRVLLMGLAVFTAASLFAGLATSVWLLVAARAVQGLGAALIPPAALAIISATFQEGEARNGALGLYGAVTGASASVGVIASGLVTENAGWRWIFLINVPIGAALLTMAARSVHSDLRRDRGQRLDVVGAVMVTAGLLALVCGLIRGAQTGWTSPTVEGSLATAALLLIGSAIVEAKSAHPLVPRAALASRSVVASIASALFTFGALFAFIFLGSLLMQDLFRYSPTRTGVAWLAMTVVSFVVAAVTGSRLVSVVGVRWLLVAGQALLAAAALLLTRVPAEGHYAADLLPALLLAGTAGGLAAPAAQIGTLAGVPHEMAGVASGMLETAREVGAVVGVAVVSTVLLSTNGGAHAFHCAYWVIVVAGVVGGLVAALVFPHSPAPVSPASSLGGHS